MKKILLMICVLLLVGCQTEPEEEIDYGPLVESSISKRYHLQNNKEVLIETVNEKFDDHNNLVEQTNFGQDSTLISTWYFGYDKQDRRTTIRIIDKDSDREVQYQYAVDQLLSHRTYEDNVLTQSVDYIYNDEEVLMTLSDPDGNILQTIDEVRIENTKTSTLTDYKFDKTTITTSTYNDEDLVVFVKEESNKVIYTRYEYNEFGHVTLIEHFQMVDGEEVISSSIKTTFVYDDEGHPTEVKNYSDGELIFRTVTEITYKE